MGRFPMFGKWGSRGLTRYQHRRARLLVRKCRHEVFQVISLLAGKGSLPTQGHWVWLVLLACLVGCASKPQLFRGRLVDLTYSFDEDTIFWPAERGFSLEKGPAGVTPEGYYYSANRFCSAEHGGTHIDAPIHFFHDRHSIDEIPLDQLIGTGAMVDVSAKCAENPDYQVQTQDLTSWEARHRLGLNNTILLLRTGFGRLWPDRRRYLGTDESGPEAVTKLRFPGLHPDAAKWLSKERQIKAIGIDTASIDYGRSTLFPTHVTLCENNIPALENVANLDQLAETGFTVIALPMKIRGGSGGPLRVIAVLP